MGLISAFSQEVIRSRVTSRRNCVASEIISRLKRKVKNGTTYNDKDKPSPPTCFLGGEHAQPAYEKLVCGLFAAWLTPKSGPVTVREARTLHWCR